MPHEREPLHLNSASPDLGGVGNSLREAIPFEEAPDFAELLKLTSEAEAGAAEGAK